MAGMQATRSEVEELQEQVEALRVLVTGLAGGARAGAAELDWPRRRGWPTWWSNCGMRMPGCRDGW